MNKQQVIIQGVPFDRYSSFMRGPASAPRHIRQALASASANQCTESCRDLANEPALQDRGDLEITDFIDDIQRPISRILESGARVIALGGDHSITYPILKAYAEVYEGLNILHLDAHPDLYHEHQGNPYSHACPFARIMEEGLAARLVQIGIRTMNPHQREQARRFNVETIDMKTWTPSYKPEFNGPVYLSLDIDVLDPAFAPGISHHEPGGLTSRDVIRLIQGLDAPVVGADIVELNPERDIHEMTAMAAAKFLKEIAGKML